jgi:signal transduction histidine kinase
MNEKIKNPPEPVKVRYSIVRKLSARLFSRLFGIFLSLDIMICLLTGASLLVYSERTAASAAWRLSELSAARPAGAEMPRIPGVTIGDIASPPDGVRIVRPFSYLLPENTRDSLRNLELTGSAAASLFGRLDAFRYNVFYESGFTARKISVELGPFMQFFRYAFCALLVFELLILTARLPKDRRIVRRTLDPIAELAEAARNLNQAESQFHPDEMAALAYKLQGINASKLDTRIQVDETQEELKNLAMAINGMLDRINASYRAQVRFVSDASHELRTPISVIQGYVNLLDRWGKNDPKTLQESITAIKDEASNMQDLVEQLLFLARGDNNTIRLQLEEVDLSGLAREVLQETRMIDTAHHFEDRSGEVWVRADRALLKQALRILVDNAIKYTDAGGHITVAAGAENGRAVLSVTDDGIGISPELVPQIFDRFYRTDASRARATGGAGLGLSIAKWITTRHGGHMEVLSRVGIGTKIQIALPASAKPAAPPTAPAAPHGGESLQ